MAIDLVQIRTQAEKKEDENFRFRAFLKTRCNLDSDEIVEFTSRTLAMIERTPTCPVVYEVMEELKRSLKFLRR